MSSQQEVNLLQDRIRILEHQAESNFRRLNEMGEFIDSLKAHVSFRTGTLIIKNYRLDG